MQGVNTKFDVAAALSEALKGEQIYIQKHDRQTTFFVSSVLTILAATILGATRLPRRCCKKSVGEGFTS